MDMPNVMKHQRLAAMSSTIVAGLQDVSSIPGKGVIIVWYVFNIILCKDSNGGNNFSVMQSEGSQEMVIIALPLLPALTIQQFVIQMLTASLPEITRANAGMLVLLQYSELGLNYNF